MGVCKYNPVYRRGVVMGNFTEETIKELISVYNQKAQHYKAVYCSAYAVEIHNHASDVSVVHIYEFILDRHYLVWETIWPDHETFLGDFANSTNKEAFVKSCLSEIA